MFTSVETTCCLFLLSFNINASMIFLWYPLCTPLRNLRFQRMKMTNYYTRGRRNNPFKLPVVNTSIQLATVNFVRFGNLFQWCLTIDMPFFLLLIYSSLSSFIYSSDRAKKIARKNRPPFFLLRARGCSISKRGKGLSNPMLEQWNWSSVGHCFLFYFPFLFLFIIPLPTPILRFLF